MNARVESAADARVYFNFQSPESRARNIVGGSADRVVLNCYANCYAEDDWDLHFLRTVLTGIHCTGLRRAGQFMQCGCACIFGMRL